MSINVNNVIYPGGNIGKNIAMRHLKFCGGGCNVIWLSEPQLRYTQSHL